MIAAGRALRRGRSALRCAAGGPARAPRRGRRSGSRRRSPRPCGRTLTSWPSADLERVAGVARAAAWPRGRPASRRGLWLWLAGQLSPVLGLADRPAPPAPRRGRGGGGRRCRWAPSRARPWPSLSSPDSSSSSVSSGSSSRRIRLETAGRLRPTRRASSSLERPSSSTRAAQARASSTGLRSSRTMFSISAACSRSASLGVADDRRHLLEAGLLGGAPAALAGDQLVAAVGEGADEQRLDDAAGLDRGGEARRAPRGRSWCAAGSGSA